MQVGAVKVTLAQNYDELKDSCDLPQFIDAAKQFTETSLAGKNEALEGIVEFANNLSMAVDLVNSVRGAHTDGELAYNLGQVLWNNSKVGGIVTALYGFVFKGDNAGMEKLALRCSEWVAAVHFGVRVGLQMKEEVIVNANYRTRLPIVVDGQSLVKAGLRPPPLAASALTRLWPSTFQLPRYRRAGVGLASSPTPLPTPNGEEPKNSSRTRSARRPPFPSWWPNSADLPRALARNGCSTLNLKRSIAPAASPAIRRGLLTSSAWAPESPPCRLSSISCWNRAATRPRKT